jgi:flagellar basal-body rod protein FlgC
MTASAFDIAAAGMTAHRAEMDVIAENLANANTEKADGGAPYRAKTAVFESASDDPFSFALDAASGDLDLTSDDGDGAAAPSAPIFAGISESDAAPQYRFDPANPLAIAAGPRRGFVALPDVDPIAQMVDLVGAGRAYDADVAALQAAKQMDVEAVDVDRT